MENTLNQDKPGQDRDKARLDRKRGTPAVSAVLSDGQLAELVFDPIERRTRFVLWQDGAWHFEEILRAPAGERLIPYSAQNNLKQPHQEGGGAVSFRALRIRLGGGPRR
jgi:hypothetical protein